MDEMKDFEPTLRVQGAFDIAVKLLQAQGAIVEPADMPGLVNVNGRELTMRQVIDLSRMSVSQ